MTAWTKLPALVLAGLCMGASLAHGQHMYEPPLPPGANGYPPPMTVPVQPAPMMPGTPVPGYAVPAHGAQHYITNAPQMPAVQVIQPQVYSPGTVVQPPIQGHATIIVPVSATSEGQVISVESGDTSCSNSGKKWFHTPRLFGGSQCQSCGANGDNGGRGPIVSCFRKFFGCDCWAHHDEYGCTSLQAECVFIFGSCRAFWGEACQPYPAPAPVPPGYTLPHSSRP